jgi:hypothetical protein
MTHTPVVPPQLADLISAVSGAHADPLDRVTGAVELADELGAAADALVGHFVDQARQGGASWSQIGRSMGMSKQAAQQRFVTRTARESAPLDPNQGFSRYADDARALVVAAQDGARRAGNDHIGIPHLLLALVAAPTSAAARALSAQVPLPEVERVATATLPSSAPSVPALIPFDAQAKAVLEGAFAQAQRMGSDQVGSEHVLLSVLVVERGTGVLAGLGVTTETAEAHLGTKGV